ncbi:hypothetical protein LZ31DRAFT_375460 [Colletotrichum somersetense]|nr:hypothetical protein LZ31DRAFT_375460 [Colletotrichum somersetense]
MKHLVCCSYVHSVGRLASKHREHQLTPLVRPCRQAYLMGTDTVRSTNTQMVTDHRYRFTLLPYRLANTTAQGQRGKGGSSIPSLPGANLWETERREEWSDGTGDLGSALSAWGWWACLCCNAAKACKVLPGDCARFWNGADVGPSTFPHGTAHRITTLYPMRCTRRV